MQRPAGAPKRHPQSALDRLTDWKARLDKAPPGRSGSYGFEHASRGNGGQVRRENVNDRGSKHLDSLARFGFTIIHYEMRPTEAAGVFVPVPGSGWGSG